MDSLGGPVWQFDTFLSDARGVLAPRSQTEDRKVGTALVNRDKRIGYSWHPRLRYRCGVVAQSGSLPLQKEENKDVLRTSKLESFGVRIGKTTVL
jgi:hypothetical protein